MGDFLYNVGYACMGTFLKRMLTASGLALGTSGISLVSMNALINYLQTEFYSLPTELLSLLGLSGFDLALSMVLGALVTRKTLDVAKIHLMVA